jgi:transposase
MWQPYLTVIRERCSQAIHILDRFHIVAKMNAALDQVRAGEARRLARDGYEPVLKKTRWWIALRLPHMASWGGSVVRLADGAGRDHRRGACGG